MKKISDSYGDQIVYLDLEARFTKTERSLKILSKKMNNTNNIPINLSSTAI